MQIDALHDQVEIQKKRDILTEKGENGMALERVEGKDCSTPLKTLTQPRWQKTETVSCKNSNDVWC